MMRAGAARDRSSTTQKPPSYEPPAMSRPRRVPVAPAPSDPAPAPEPGRERPYWSRVLRALREARAVTREGWAARLGYGVSTVQRWETGTAVPDGGAEVALVALCAELRLFRPFDRGVLAGLALTEEWLRDLLATARLE